MYYFCTYFDQNYLALGLALYRSLKRHVKDFELNILCMDDYTYEFLTRNRFPNIKLLPLAEFEKANQEFARVKQNRTLLEYYYTCTPVLLLHLLKENPAIDVLTYLDADLFFYSDPGPIYKELETGSILIVPHRFSESMQYKEKYGIYNVGLLSFYNDSTSRECLKVWRTQCLQWCGEKPEDGKYGDQKYLDDWPALYRGVIVLQHKGAGLGNWNIDNYSYHNEKNGDFYIDENRLIFYHFHGLKMINRFIFQADRDIESTLIRSVYAPYIRELQSVMKRILNGTMMGTVRTKAESFTERIRLIIHRHSIVVVGPFSFKVYLGTFLKPLFYLKRILT